MDLYREEIIDRYKNPRNFGEIKGVEAQSNVANLSCGDNVSWSMQVEGDVVKDAKFKGSGCAISTAGADLLCDFIKGKQIKEIKEIRSSDVVNLFQMSLSPSRARCALMGWEAMQRALKAYESDKKD